MNEDWYSETTLWLPKMTIFVYRNLGYWNRPVLSLHPTPTSDVVSNAPYMEFLQEEMLVSYRRKWTLPNPYKIHIWPKDLTISDPNKNRVHKKVKSIHVDMIFMLKWFQYCFIYNFLRLLTIIMNTVLGLADKGN